MKEPVDHILRPRLPWRSPAEPAITECGYDASKVKVIGRNGYKNRLAELGQQRSAMFTCMTCADAAKRWPTWDEDPRQALEREITWEGGRWNRGRGHRLLDELRAIAALIESRQDEYAALLTNIEQRRQWIEKKNAK